MAQANTLIGLLELVRSAGGTIESRIRIQKEAYLLATQKLGRFRLPAFSYHHYGPYSRELSDALQFAVSSNFLEETCLVPDDGSYTKYSYELTDKGNNFLDSEGADTDGIQNKVREWTAQNWRTLELAATVKYLELEGSVSNRDEAFAKAIELKPATARFIEDAKSVLRGIG